MNVLQPQQARHPSHHLQSFRQRFDANSDARLPWVLLTWTRARNLESRSDLEARVTVPSLFLPIREGPPDRDLADPLPSKGFRSARDSSLVLASGRGLRCSRDLESEVFTRAASDASSGDAS